MTTKYCNACGKPFPVQDYAHSAKWSVVEVLAPTHEKFVPFGDGIDGNWVTCPGSRQPMVEKR